MTLTAILSAIGGGTLVALIAWARFRSKDSAETEKIRAEAEAVEAQTVEKLTSIATSLLTKAIEQAEFREQRFEAKILVLESKVDHLTKTVDSLADQLREHGLTPVFPPMPPMPGGVP